MSKEATPAPVNEGRRALIIYILYLSGIALATINHAGEFGATRIYSARIAVAKRLSPDCVDMLSEMLGHEIRHCRLFREAMPERNSRPCRVMQFWSWGGWWLGFLTALLGRRGIWACTAAVEETVHRHLDDQLHFLAGRALHDVIASIREEELAHLHHAEEQLESDGVHLSFLRRLVGTATDTLIWLSTWGDSGHWQLQKEGRPMAIRRTTGPPHRAGQDYTGDIPRWRAG